MLQQAGSYPLGSRVARSRQLIRARWRRFSAQWGLFSQKSFGLLGVVLIVGFVALYAVFSRQAAYLDVAAAYALVAFLGTAAFARFLERSAAVHRAKRKKPTPEVKGE